MSQCCAIDLGDSLRRDARIDFRRHLFIRQLGSPACAFNDPLTIRSEQTKLYLSPAAEPLLTGAVLHLQWKAKQVKTGVHCLVEYGRRNFGVRELGIHGERELHQASSLLVEVSSSTREALYDDVREIALEMAEMMRNVPRDEGKAALETRDHVDDIDVGSRIVDDDLNTHHVATSNR